MVVGCGSFMFVGCWALMCVGCGAFMFVVYRASTIVVYRASRVSRDYSKQRVDDDRWMVSVNIYMFITLLHNARESIATIGELICKRVVCAAK